jgi:hypothetical protein
MVVGSGVRVVEVKVSALESFLQLPCKEGVGVGRGEVRVVGSGVRVCSPSTQSQCSQSLPVAMD